MNLFADFPPALILILGALLVPVLPVNVRRVYVILLPLLALIQIATLPLDFKAWQVSLPWLPNGESITWLRVDKLSRIFGIVFALNASLAFLYAFYVKKSTQHTASLIYIGSALGAVFAGDLISLYVFWEIMAVSSTFIILARKTDKAKSAAYRYIMIHLFGGLLFLGGMVLTISQRGSISFDQNAFNYLTDQHLGTWLILLGFLVNAAAPPLSAWLSDAYPEASVTGGLILSAYTTKTAVYALLRGFPGWDPLIWIGCFMAIYGIIFALLENDMRRILAYSIINQVGFMVCAAGIGGEIAISGASAHAFCHIIYKSLLWMSAGAVLYRVGESRCTKLGGLYKTMPLTLIFGTIGALAISAFPLTSGFTSKTIILFAAEKKELFWPWFILEAASAGVFLHAGIKFPYFVFFNQDRGLRPKEAPRTMLAAMAIMAFLCIFLGIWTDGFYQLLPYRVNYQAWTFAHLVTQLQLLFFSALVFFLMLGWLKRTNTITLDTDWFYRKLLPPVVDRIGLVLNRINSSTRHLVVDRFVGSLSQLAQSGPTRFLGLLATPVWKAQNLSSEELAGKQQELERQSRAGAFPIGITALLAVLLLAMLSAYFVLR